MQIVEIWKKSSDKGENEINRLLNKKFLAILRNFA